MKKLFIIPAILLGFTISANAQVDAAAAKTAPATEKVSTSTDQKEYAKIEPSEVDSATLMTAMKKYKGFSISEANKAEDGEYKLVLANKEGKMITAFFAKSGAFLKEA